MRLSIFQPKKLNYVVLFLAFYSIANVKSETNETSNVTADENKTPVVVPEQKSVKKQLKINITNEAAVEIMSPNKSDEHNEKLVIINEKTVTDSLGKTIEQQTSQKGNEKSSVLETVTKPGNLQHENHLNEEFILNNADDISESLKTGFYFFLILSSGAIVFIVFKIYRLRLTRAERKYGVQGDRSTQELTPLPISIEDGHSDDEDHTLFEVQRQNIRIL